MKHSKFSVFWLIAALSVSIHTVGGQVINATAQNASPLVVTSRVAPAAKPIGNTSGAPRVAARPTSFNVRTFNAGAPRMISQPGVNLRANNPQIARPLNPALATMRVQKSARPAELEPIRVDPATHQTELRTVAAIRERHGVGKENRTLAAIDTQRHRTPHDQAMTGRRPHPHGSPDDPAKTRWRNKNDRSFFNAFHRHRHEWHDRDWWHGHCDTIVFVNTGYYFLDGNYWYPALGYDPLNNYSDYDGPIYTYGNLLPDEVIANVQVALQDAGYYSGAITGSLSGETRAALANFQRDYGLTISGAIDEPTVEMLGLYDSGPYQVYDVPNSN
jgi:Putative peptidoglycan binding domain